MTDAAPAPPHAPPPTPRYAYYVLGVLLLANLMNYVDRFVLSAILPLIQADWGISMATGGYLSSAFTVGFMLSAPFIGALADRKSRTRIVAACVLVWSLATVGAGLSPGITCLLLCRVVIGVGEAGCLAVGPTLVADSFPRSSRSLALSIFYLGTPLGGAVGYALGAGLGDTLGWRWPLVLAGAIGVVPTILIWIMREPARGASDASDPHASTHAPPRSWKEYADLCRNTSFLLVMLALAAAACAGTPLLHFLPGFVTEYRDIPLKKAGLSIGLIAALAGTFGTLAGGYLGDRLFRRTRKAHFLLAGGAYILSFPCILVGLYAPSKLAHLAGLSIGVFAIFGALTILNTLVANVSRPEIRAMAYSALIFAMHLLGDAFSPPFFGRLIDAFGYKTGFFYMTLPFAVSAAACLIGLTTVEADLQKAVKGIPSADATGAGAKRSARTGSPGAHA